MKDNSEIRDAALTGCPDLLKIRVPHMLSCAVCMQSRMNALMAIQKTFETGEFQQPPPLCPEMEAFLIEHKRSCRTCQEIPAEVERMEKDGSISLSHQEILESTKKARSKKKCSSPDSSQCSGEIINAHSVQKKQLEKIARNGHVYHFKGDYDNLLKNDWVFKAAQISVEKKASTFSGFCKHHDDFLFAPIEKQSFLIDQQKSFLLAYRAICFELFNQEIGLDLFQLHRQLVNGFPWEMQIIFQSELGRDEEKQKWAVLGLQSVKSEYDQALRNQDFSRMNYYAVEVDSELPFLWSGVSSPQWDFEGHEIQKFSGFKTPAALTFSSVIVGTHTLLVFGWLGESPELTRFVKSFHLISDDELLEASRRYVFELVENTYFNPDWWENNPEVQQFIEHTINHNFQKKFRGSAKQLTPDGYRFLSGKINSRSKNVSFQ